MTRTALRTLRTWLPGDPPNLDPQTGVDEWSYRLHIAWLEGLIRPRADGRPEPALARRWQVGKDQTEVTVYLRPEATWSDGRPVTADDVRYGIERALDPDLRLRAAWQMYVLEGGRQRHQRESAVPLGVTVLAPDTVQLTLAEPVPYLTELWALPPFAPLRRDASPGPSLADVTSVPVTGPFRLVEYEPGRFVRFVRNERYWDGGVTPPAELTVHLGGDPVARFHSGEIDLAPIGEVEAAELDPSVVVRSSECAVLYLLLNARDSTTGDPRIRAAIGSALDPAKISRNAARACPPLRRLVPDTPGAADYLASSPSVGLARTATTGPLAGVSLSLLCGDLPQNVAEANAVAEQLTRAGARVQLAPTDYTSRFQSIRGADYQLALVAWKADFDDPLGFLREHVSDGAAGNQSKWSDAVYDRLVATARVTPERERRWAALAEAEQRLLASCHVIPLLQRTRPWLVRPGLCDIVHRPAGPSPDLRWVRET